MGLLGLTIGTVLLMLLLDTSVPTRNVSQKLTEKYLKKLKSMRNRSDPNKTLYKEDVWVYSDSNPGVNKSKCFCTWIEKGWDGFMAGADFGCVGEDDYDYVDELEIFKETSVHDAGVNWGRSLSITRSVTGGTKETKRGGRKKCKAPPITKIYVKDMRCKYDSDHNYKGKPGGLEESPEGNQTGANTISFSIAFILNGECTLKKFI